MIVEPTTLTVVVIGLPPSIDTLLCPFVWVASGESLRSVEIVQVPGFNLTLVPLPHPATAVRICGVSLLPPPRALIAVHCERVGGVQGFVVVSPSGKVA